MKVYKKIVSSILVFSLVAVCFPIEMMKVSGAEENAYLPTITAVAGGKEKIEMSITPNTDAPGDLQYYVYLDGTDAPVRVINPKIEAESRNGNSGTMINGERNDTEGNPVIDIGGTKNGNWTRYDNVDFGEGTASKFTARYSVADNSVGNNPKLEVYIDTLDNEENLVGTLALQKGDGNSWEKYKMGTVELTKTVTGKHNIYIKYCVDNNQNVCNLDWFSFSVSPLNMKLTNVTPGMRTVSIKTFTNGTLSGEAVTAEVYVEAIKSGQVGLQGFQIKTNNRLSYKDMTYDISGVAYRTICYAPSKGSSMDVDGVSYTVTDMGTIYVPDVQNNLDPESSTYLDMEEGPKEREDAYGTYKYYVGKNAFGLTYGYLATEDGMLKNLNESENKVYYVRSLVSQLEDFVQASDFNKFLQTTMHVRSFVLAEDADGNQITVYGENTQDISIAEIADYVYSNSLAPNYQGHKYLYDKILSQIDSTNQYYKDSEVDYGWNDNLYTPENPTATYPTLIEKGDPEAKTDVLLNDMWKGIAFTTVQGVTGANETPDKLFDGNTGTKFCAKSDELTPLTIGWEMKRAVTVKSYTLVTGNDTSKNLNRNPHSWKFYGSVDGETWEVLDTVEDGGIEAKDTTEYTYNTDRRKACLYFKLEIIDSGTAGNYGQFGNLQLSEIYLNGDIVPAKS